MRKQREEAMKVFIRIIQESCMIFPMTGAYAHYSNHHPTGIQNWNVLCRWALCWSLAEPSVPGGVDPLSDSNVEMDWSTFAGEYSEIYEAIIRQRCINDGLGDDEKTLRLLCV